MLIISLSFLSLSLFSTIHILSVDMVITLLLNSLFCYFLSHASANVLHEEAFLHLQIILIRQSWNTLEGKPESKMPYKHFSFIFKFCKDSHWWLLYLCPKLNRKLLFNKRSPTSHSFFRPQLNQEIKIDLTNCDLLRVSMYLFELSYPTNYNISIIK